MSMSHDMQHSYRSITLIGNTNFDCCEHDNVTLPYDRNLVEMERLLLKLNDVSGGEDEVYSLTKHEERLVMESRMRTHYKRARETLAEVTWIKCSIWDTIKDYRNEYYRNNYSYAMCGIWKRKRQHKRMCYIEKFLTQTLREFRALRVLYRK